MIIRTTTKKKNLCIVGKSLECPKRVKAMSTPETLSIFRMFTNFDLEIRMS